MCVCVCVLCVCRDVVSEGVVSELGEGGGGGGDDDDTLFGSDEDTNSTNEVRV